MTLQRKEDVTDSLQGQILQTWDVMYHTHKSDKWVSAKLYSETSEYYDRRETSASVQTSLKHI